MASSAPFSFLYGMCSLSVCGWRGARLPAIGSALDLDQDFARVDAIALGHMHGLDGTIDGSLDLAFHLHRLTYQHGLTGLDLVALGDQHIYDVPGHAGSHMSGLAGALARDRKSTRLNSSHVRISYAVFCLKKKKNDENANARAQQS